MPGQELAPPAANDTVMVSGLGLEWPRPAEAGVSRRRRYAQAGIVAAVAVGLIGLASLPFIGRPSSAGDVIGAAAAVARREASAHIHIDERVTVGAVSLSIPADGQVDIAGRNAEVVVDLSHLPSAPKGLTGIDLVTSGGAIYVRIPEAKRAANNGKGWIEVRDPLTAGTQQLGAGLGGFAGTGVSALDSLTQAGATVEETGREDIRGTPATRYHFMLDLHQLLERAPDAARQVLASLGTSQVQSIDGDVWIADDGTPRRLAQSVSVPAGPGSPQGTRLDLSVDFFDYGVPVTVPMPAATDTIVALSMAEALHIVLT
jgi:hypothetical protein